MRVELLDNSYKTVVVGMQTSATDTARVCTLCILILELASIRCWSLSVCAVTCAQGWLGPAAVQGPSVFRPVASGDGGRAQHQRVHAQRHGASARRHPRSVGRSFWSSSVDSIAERLCAVWMAAQAKDQLYDRILCAGRSQVMLLLLGWLCSAKERTKGSAFAEAKSTLRFKLVFKVRASCPASALPAVNSSILGFNSGQVCLLLFGQARRPLFRRRQPLLPPGPFSSISVGCCFANPISCSVV